MSHSNDNVLAKVIDLTENYHFSVKKNIYRETLRQLLNVFGNIYYLDGSNNRIKVKCTTSKPDRATGKDANENNLVLPYITISEIGSEEADDRRRVHNLLVNEKVWDPKENRAKRYLSLVPKAININYEINIWAKFNSDLDQIRYSIFSLFHPSLEIRTNFSDFTKAFVKNETDITSPQAGDTTDRLIQKTISISVETYLPSPKFLYTNTGEIKSFNAEVTLDDSRSSVTEQLDGTNVRIIEIDNQDGESGPSRILTLSGSLVDVNINSVNFGDVLIWGGQYWVASGLAELIGGENLNHQLLTNRGALDAHPQYASSSLSSYAFELSSTLGSHIENSNIHFTSGSLSGAYVLSSTNSNLSSLVSSIQASTISLSSYIEANEESWAQGVTDHGSLSGLEDNDHPQYASSSVSAQIQSVSSYASSVSSIVSSHLGSSVHWELSTLNANYLNSSGDSTSAGFYLSSVSSTNISSTNYYNLPSSTLVWEAARDIVLLVRNGYASRTILKGEPVTIVSGTGNSGGIPIVEVLSSVNTHVPDADLLSNHVAGLARENIAAGNEGYIIVEGLLTGINTDSFFVGDWLYVSSNGQLSNQRPTPPYESHPVGVVTRSQQINGTILVKIENSPEVNDIVGFNLSQTLIDGDLITYDYSTSTFLNKQSINISGTIKAPTLSGTVVSAGTLHVGGSDGIIRNNNGDIIISATNGIVRFPFGLSAASVSTTSYTGLPSSTALWNASQLQGRNINSTTPGINQVLVYDGSQWIPSSIPSGAGGTNDHALLINRGLADAHPQYASSSVSAQIQSVSSYASGVSSIVSSHINDPSIHFTSGSLSGAYVLSSTNNALSSQVNNLQASTASISSIVNSHINDSSIHFTSGSLSGYYAASSWTENRYVLSSTNSNLSSLVSNIQTSANNLSSVVGAHIASADVHFTSGSLSGAYVLSSTNNALSSQVNNLQASTASISSVVNSHINDPTIHFTSGSLSGYYAASSWTENRYVLSSTNSNLSSLVLNIQTSANNLSAVVGAHIASADVHFTSGSLSGFYAGSAWADNRYVLSSVNSNLSSLVSSIQASTVEISSTVNNHLGSAVHWDLPTLNNNYLNSSGDSANSAFYLSSLSATTFSATTYRNLPVSSLSGLADVQITGTPTTNHVLKWNGTKWAPAADATGTGGGISNSFAIIEDESLNTVTATGEDTVRFVSRTNGVTITADNTQTPQEVSFEINEAAIQHNILFGLTTGNPHTQYATLSGSVFSGQIRAPSVSATSGIFTNLSATTVSASTYQNLPSGTATWNANSIQGVDVSAFNSSTVRIASSLLLPSALIFGSGIPSTAQLPAGIYYTTQSAENAPPAIYQCNNDNLNVYANFGQGKSFRIVDQVAAGGGFAGSGYDFDGNSFIIQHGANNSATLVVPSNGVLQVQNTLSATTVSANNYFGLTSQVIAASAAMLGVAVNSATPGALIFSRSISGISTGDIIDVEINGTFLNNTTGTVTVTGVYQLGTFSATVADGTTIANNATNQVVFNIKASFTVAATNNCGLVVYQTRAVPGAAGAPQNIAVNTYRHVFVTGSTNLTGTQTFNFRFISTALATQTFTLHNYKITRTRTI